MKVSKKIVLTDVKITMAIIVIIAVIAIPLFIKGLNKNKHSGQSTPLPIVEKKHF